MWTFSCAGPHVPLANSNVSQFGLANARRAVFSAIEVHLGDDVETRGVEARQRPDLGAGEEMPRYVGNRGDDGPVVRKAKKGWERPARVA